MTKFIRILFLSMIFLFSSVMAFDSPLIEPKVAVKMISNSSTQFIMAEKNSMKIIGSQNINIQKLYEGDILGNMPCKPFYICPNSVRNSLERLGIKNNQELILYDNHYGLYATTLYMVLESIGHKNMKIFNGGLLAVEKLDPNRQTYNKYYNELMEMSSLLQKEKNATVMEKFEVKSVDLNQKLSVLKPSLLVQKTKKPLLNKDKSHYKIEKSKFNLNHFLDSKGLKKVVATARKEGEASNVSIIDACSMMDIVGNKYGNYLPGVKSIDWKEMVDSEKKGFKSNDLLEKIFMEAGLKKENNHYVYCMSGSPKAFYVLLALRSAGYNKVKAFTGDWNVWRGDVIEP